MQSSFGKNANAGKYFHEQELLFFLQFDFPYTICFYSECVRRKTLLFFFFICFSTSTIIWILGESWYLKLLNGKTAVGKTAVVYIFSSRYKISIEEGEDLRTF